MEHILLRYRYFVQWTGTEDLFSFGLDEETKKIDYELILNFAYRSTHSMAVLAKKVIEAVYGEKPAYSYIQVASGGGRQTMTEAQIYPEEIVTEEDVRVMQLIFDGPKTRDNKFIWYGFRPGTHFWSSGAIGEQGGGCNIKKMEDGNYRPSVNSMFGAIVDSWTTRNMNYDWSKMNYKKLEDIYRESVRVIGCLECNCPDLYDAEQSGAKILLTHAVNDDTIPSDGTIDYYKKVVSYTGDENRVQNYLRLFMTPEGGHTDLASPGLNLTTSIGMTALMKWVEEGEVPELLDGLQYDFEQNTPVLTGKVSLYRVDEPSRCVEINETPAYALKDEFDPNLRFNKKSTVKEIQSDPEGNEILKKYLGDMLENPMVAPMLGAGIGQVQKLMPNKEIQDKLAECMNELFTLEKKKTDRVYGKMEE